MTAEPAIDHLEGDMSLADDYLTAIAEQDVDGMRRLFAPGGLVHSPLWGTVPASDFYPMLFGETKRAQATVRKVFAAEDGALAFWFDYVWTLPDGSESAVNAVDVVELAPDGRIQEIFIVYDTAALTPGFAEKARRSRP